MHYLVDGYNLLFKTAWAGKLEEARRKLIEELDDHASRLHLHITLVFDAPLQSETLQRGHFRSLEIIFTARGETADDFIANSLSRHHHRTTVVTSDKNLARRVKGEGIFVESAHDFLQRLRKKSLKKSLKTNVKQSPPIQKKEPPPTKKVVTPKGQTGLPDLGDIDAWTAIFEQKYSSDYKKNDRKKS